MDNAFCVEKGGGRWEVEEGRGLEGLFTRDATRCRIGFALFGRRLEVSAQRWWERCGAIICLDYYNCVGREKSTRGYNELL